MQKWVYVFLGAIACMSCGQFTGTKKDTGTPLVYKDVIVYNTFRDTCMIFRDEVGDTIRFHRRYRILENTFSDTMNISLELIKPGQKREIFCKQMDTATNGGMDPSEEHERYLEERDLPVLYTPYICMYHWHSNGRYYRKEFPPKPTEYIKLRIWYKPKKKTAP
jgi:hypothetical protein